MGCATSKPAVVGEDEATPGACLSPLANGHEATTSAPARTPSWAPPTGLTPPEGTSSYQLGLEVHPAVRLASRSPDEAYARVEHLLACGAQVGAVEASTGATPLSLACHLGIDLMVLLLLQHRANPNTRNPVDGDAPLHVAVRAGRLDIARKLLDAGADVNASNNFNTPLHVAAGDATSQSSLQMVELLLARGARVNERDAVGATPLHVAASWADTEVVQRLLDCGADYKAVNNEGKVPLQCRGPCSVKVQRLLLTHWLMKAAEVGDVPAIEAAIVQHGADPNARSSSSGSCALHVAAREGRAEAISCLLRRGADVRLVDARGCTALHIAARSGEAGSARLLLRPGGADPDARNEDGETSLHLAAREGHASVLKVLLDGGAGVDALDATGATALHEASCRGDLAPVQALLDGGANPSVKERLSGSTALHMVAQWGMPSTSAGVVEALVAAGARVWESNYEGLSAIDIARRVAAANAGPSPRELLTLGSSGMVALLESQNTSSAANGSAHNGSAHNGSVHNGSALGSRLLSTERHMAMLSQLEPALMLAPSAPAQPARPNAAEYPPELLPPAPIAAAVPSNAAPPAALSAGIAATSAYPEIYKSSALEAMMSAAERQDPADSPGKQRAVIFGDLEAASDPLRNSHPATPQVQPSPVRPPSEYASLVDLPPAKQPSAPLAPVPEPAAGAAAALLEQASGPSAAPAVVHSVKRVTRVLRTVPVTTAPAPASPFQALSAAQALAPGPHFTAAAASQPGVAPVSGSSGPAMSEAHSLPLPAISALPVSPSPSAAVDADANLRIDSADLHVQMLRRGGGSYGEVYLGTYLSTPVAVKVLGPLGELPDGNGMVPPLLLRALHREVGVMRALYHPNIQRLMGYCTNFQGAGRPAIVSQWYAAGGLHDVFAKARKDKELENKLDWARRLRMAHDIAAGMLYLHTRSTPIVHRDLKAANCFVNQHYEVCVGDFGLTKLLSETASAASSGQGANQPRWAAPEVRAGGPATPRSDVYSYGILMWELLVWQAPWPRLSAWQVVNILGQGGRPEVPPLKDLPGPDNFQFTGLHSYVGLMELCWAELPQRRPTFKDVVHHLQRMIQEHDKQRRRQQLAAASEPARASPVAAPMARQMSASPLADGTAQWRPARANGASNGAPAAAPAPAAVTMDGGWDF